MDTPRRPKLLIIGHGTHGKDTVGELLKAYGFNPKGSSEFATERLMMPAFANRGTPYATAAECYADRANHRDFWFDTIRDFNQASEWCGLAKELLLAGHDTYIGMRSRQELEASRPLFDWVVWVDASRRLDPEPTTSNQLTAADADWVIDNNQTIAGLMLQTKLFLQLIGWDQAPKC